MVGLSLYVLSPPCEQPGKDSKEKVVFPGDGYEGGDKEFVDPDWNQVRQEIEARTRRRAGCQLGIVDQSIVVKLESPAVFDLELVDLPGFTRNPVRE